jgi:ABC-type transport system involved in multi-copper enzyme maturation permease subunit
MNEKSPATKRAWFYVTWGAILFIGDGLCWGTADYFWTHNLIALGDFFYWLFWVVSLLSAGRIILETWESPKVVWTVSCTCSLLIGFIIILVSARKTPPMPVATPRPVAVPAPTEPFIEGTEVTHKQLSDTFPFGYTVFFSGENKRFRYEVFSNGLYDWNIDCDKVKIEPDIAAGMVTWTIPVITGVSIHGDINNCA